MFGCLLMKPASPARSQPRFNNVAELNSNLRGELERIGDVVGKQGKIGQKASLGEASAGWQDCINSVNGLVGDLVRPTTEVARVIGSVAKGDLSESMALEIEGVPLKGEFLRTAKTINTMVEQLGSFASEVTRVAREVGNRRKTRRSSASQRSFWNLERPDRFGQFNG